jgi:hypothetical protein
MTTNGLYWFDVHEHPVGSMSMVSIVLKTHSVLPDGSIAISPQMTAVEIDENIRQLKAELDIVARKAKVIAQ